MNNSGFPIIAKRKLSLGSLILFLMALFFPSSSYGKLLMNTRGQLNIMSFTNGFDDARGLYPGYRSEFMTDTEFFSARGLIFSAIIGNKTIITKGGGDELRMDRIRYTLIPKVRYEFRDWLIRGALHHECIHTISQPEFNGSVWWNSFQLGIGSKGADRLYLIDEYRNLPNGWYGKFDILTYFGWVIPAQRTLTSGQNHAYIHEVMVQLRYHIGLFHGWATFVTLKHHSWYKIEDVYDHQLIINYNFMRHGRYNLAGFYFSQSVYDQFEPDNDGTLGAFGVRLIF